MSDLIKRPQVVRLASLERLALDGPQPGDRREGSQLAAGNGQCNEDLLAAATTRAEQVVAEARKRAEELLQGASTQIAAEREAAQRQGLEQGLAQAQAETEAELLAMRQALERMAAEVRDDFERLLDEVRRSLARLSVQVAEKILRARLETDPLLVEGLVRQAIQQFGSADGLRVLVSVPDSGIPDLRRRLADLLEGSEGVEIAHDAAAGWGGCIVRGPLGTVDARCETQLERLRQPGRSGATDADS